MSAQEERRTAEARRLKSFISIKIGAMFALRANAAILP
jgi:hypothetical protein